ncbi:Major facilitator protein [Dioscorea alata]|uniref:Major facilitator protein n=1 Tax=Dioscorea alata TaxID=55571 RepID=A0ACB7WPN7_DIOAL|nr:Major facilitator protein [Dioscorea alata]
MKDLAGMWHLFACVFLFNLSGSIVIPAITDVTMEALCPGKDECSLAIYLSGFQQAVTGLGTLIVTPLIGNLSDKHGRKALLTLPMTIAIIPLAILAYDRSRVFFYAYFAVKMFTGIFCEGSMQCLSLAYTADTVSERSRASAFGVLSGVSMAGFVSGTITSRFLTSSSTFQLSTIVAIVGALYMRVFLAETNRRGTSINGSSQPLCASCPSNANASSPPKLSPLRNAPSLNDMIYLLKSSSTMSRAAVIVFFNGLGETGIQASLLYYLKALFHFNKDQFADLLLIVGIAGAISQLILMPMLAPLGEEKLLNVGLLAGCANIFLYSVAWSSWVPYLASSFVVLSVFTHPCIRSIVSKKVGSDEQGMAQGCITGIASVASILSPFVFTPLTVLFLSDNPPFNFKGFSIMCSGFSTLAAFTLSIMMRDITEPILYHKHIDTIHAQV